MKFLEPTTNIPERSYSKGDKYKPVFDKVNSLKSTKEFLPIECETKTEAVYLCQALDRAGFNVSRRNLTVYAGRPKA